MKTKNLRYIGFTLPLDPLQSGADQWSWYVDLVHVRPSSGEFLYEIESF